MCDDSGILKSLLSCDLSEIKKLAISKESANCKIEGGDGLTLLHIAAGVISPHIDQVVSYLLQLGANPNSRAQDGLTPVHIAAMWNNYGVLEKLLCYGGSPWLHDFDGKNAFDLAQENNAEECNEFLINFKRKLKAGSDASDGSVSIVSSIHDINDNIDSESEDSSHFLINKDLYDITKKINALTVDGKIDECSDSSEIIDTFERIKLWLQETNKQLKNPSIKKESSDYFSDFSKFQAKTFSSVSESQDSKTFDSKSESLSETLSDLSCSVYQSSCISNENEDDLDLLDNTWGTLIDETLNETVLPGMASSEHEIEITHTDDEEGIVLIEKWGSSYKNDLQQNNSCVSSSSGKTSWKSFKTAHDKLSSSLSTVSEELKKLSNTQIFSELAKRGDCPGPVTESTRHLYLQRLARLKDGLAVKYPLSPAKYSAELTRFLENKLDLKNAELLEREMSADFDRDSVIDNWREGGQRCSFNYFLLDPRVSRNLPLRSQSLSSSETIEIFLNSLFYVGKGTRSRPYHHLYEATKAVNSKDNNNELSSKVNHILDIWKSGFGVVCLHCFQNSIPAEAYTREACIIEAIGLSNLTNIKKGNFYGIAAKWKGSKKKQVGVLLLSRALKIFCLEGERLIRPRDINVANV